MRGRLKRSRLDHEEGPVDIDPQAMAAVMEESADLHHDAMVTTTVALDEMVENGLEARAHDALDPEESHRVADRRSQLMTGALFGGGILAAAGVAGAFEALFSSPAFASSATDVQILQTASSIEVLAVATYKTALTLPFIGGSAANPVVKTFATTTMQQHSQHLSAFNAAITGLGGKPQTNPDPVLGKVVQAAVPGLTSPGPWWRWPSSWSRGRRRPMWPTSPP